MITINAQGPDWLTLASGLIGIVLGAVLTYFVTNQFERQRLHDDRLAKSYNLVFAVLKIADDLTKMEQDVRRAMAKAKKEGAEGDLWTKLTIGVGYAEPVTIPSADLSVVALTRDNDLVTQIGEVEAAHRIYWESMKAFQALQEKFESFGLQTAVEGETVTFEADQLQIPKIGPTVIRLRTLSQSICADLPKAAEQARAVGARLGPHLKSHYRFKHFITLSFPDNAGHPND